MVLREADLSALELLELDLDVRILALWLQAWEVEQWETEIVAPFLRVAYWTGYRDALTENQRGKLYADCGQRVPARGSGSE